MCFGYWLTKKKTFTLKRVKIGENRKKRTKNECKKILRVFYKLHNSPYCHTATLRDHGLPHDYASPLFVGPEHGETNENVLHKARRRSLLQRIGKDVTLQPRQVASCRYPKLHLRQPTVQACALSKCKSCGSVFSASNWFFLKIGWKTMTMHSVQNKQGGRYKYRHTPNATYFAVGQSVRKQYRQSREKRHINSHSQPYRGSSTRQYGFTQPFAWRKQSGPGEYTCLVTVPRTIAIHPVR